VQRIDISACPVDRRFSSDLDANDKHLVGFHIQGECPSCQHQTNALCATKYIEPEDPDIVRSRQARRTELGITQHLSTGGVTQITLLRCACIADHPGAKDQLGCGSEWLLEVNYAKTLPRGTVGFNIVPADELAHFWSVANDRSTAISTLLSQAQGAATKWQTGLTAILGVLAIGTILTGRDTISTFSVGWKIAIAAALIVALLGNAFMLYFSNVASIGPLLRRSSFNPEPLKDADLAPLKAASRSAAKLRNAFYATVASFLGALFAVGIYAYGPSVPASPAITTPTPVVYLVPSNLPSRNAVGLPPKCAASQLEAIAIGGTLAIPTIVTTAEGSCPSITLTVNPGDGQVLFSPTASTGPTTVSTAPAS
jgi:hypothetical protein